jgi:hypothetical protein
MMGRYNIDAARQNAAQQAQLAARGMNVGSAQYGTVQEAQDRARADALQQAYLGSGEESRRAEGAYNQAALQKYQMGADWATQLNNLRQGQFQERLALRNQPLNEISALLSGSQVTLPSFNPFQSQGINAPNIMGAVNQNYQQQAQNANAFNSGLFELASAGLGGWMGRPA